MAGRFIAVPVYVAVFLFATVRWHAESGSRNPSETTASMQPSSTGGQQLLVGTAVTVTLLAVSAAAGAVPVSLLASQEPRWKIDQNFNAFTLDARGSSTAGGMSLRQVMNNLSLDYINPDVAPLGDGSGLARTLREVDRAARNWPVNDGTFTLPSEVGAFCGFLGNLGIATGPTVHLVDDCALTDRFLASRTYTPAKPFAWNPGHFHRGVPDGYLEAIRLNDPSLMADPGEGFLLRELWSRIRP